MAYTFVCVDNDASQNVKKDNFPNTMRTTSNHEREKARLYYHHRPLISQKYHRTISGVAINVIPSDNTNKEKRSDNKKKSMIYSMFISAQEIIVFGSKLEWLKEKTLSFLYYVKWNYLEQLCLI